MGSVGIVDFGIDDFVFKVQPDAGVVAAIVGAAKNGALGVDGATKALAMRNGNITHLHPWRCGRAGSTPI